MHPLRTQDYITGYFIPYIGLSHWGDPSVDGRIILTQIFRKWNVGIWTGLSWLKIETGGWYL
jgi:hypothetical protein